MRGMQGVPLARLAAPSFVASFPLALVAFAAGCGGEQDNGVTYQKDISTLFADCTLCHNPGSPSAGVAPQGPDILDPYAPGNGLTVAPNYWKEGHKNLPYPERDVTPGDPDQSFLLIKLSDPSLGLLSDAGAYMPYNVPPITPDELAKIEQWVSSGAQDDDFFRNQVYGIFVGPLVYQPGKCDLCHYKGTPHPPDMTDPFGPDGVVGIPSIFRNDLLRVAPGDPDASLLVQRVRESAGDNLPSSEFGAPMPKPVTHLDDAQQALVRQWILEGARP
jgi:hypothetical protein